MSKTDNFKGKGNTNGLKQNPQNINRAGAQLSMRTALKKMLEKGGELTIPADQVLSINDDGSVKVELPTRDKLLMKLSSWAMGNNTAGIRALIHLFEQDAGKAHQTNTTDLTQSGDINLHIVEED